jgi:hypothetical protein
MDFFSACMRQGVVALGIMIVGFVILVVSFLGPWYTIQGSGALGANYDIEFFLSHIDAHGTFLGQMISVSLSYAQASMSAPNIGVNTSSYTVIDTARSLMLLALASGVAAIVCMIGFVLRFGKSLYTKYLGVGFAVLTAVLGILPLMYFMSTVFMKGTSGFWFHETGFGLSVIGGPGYGWYLMIVVAVVALISAVVLLLARIVPVKSMPSDQLDSHMG